MAIAIVSGALANKHLNGGNAWSRLSWALGLERLGYRVYLVEQIDPTPASTRWCRRGVRDFRRPGLLPAGH